MRFLTVALLVFLTWALPSAAAQAGMPESTVGIAKTAKAGKPKLAKALRKCRAFKKAARRKSCARKARRRFAKKPSKPVKPVKPVEPAPKPGELYRVDVLDTYENDWFSPNMLELKVGDSIEWIWSDLNQNPHNVTLISGPAGVNRRDYMTPNSPSRRYRWVRRLDRAGTWAFVCSLHHLMSMTVKVSK